MLVESSDSQLSIDIQTMYSILTLDIQLMILKKVVDFPEENKIIDIRKSFKNTGFAPFLLTLVIDMIYTAIKKKVSAF